MKRNKGITFTELMISFGITALISGILYFILSDSFHRANLTTARNHIKQEANKVLKILENDLSQAKANSFSQSSNEFSIKVHLKDEDKHGIKDLFGSTKIENPTIKYKFTKPKLLRNFEKKWLIVSDVVDSIEIQEPSEAEKASTPGKLVIKLVMKSNQIDLKDSEQPTYEQNKVVIIREEAASKNDPNWFGVGKLYDNYGTDDNLLASLKSDVSQFLNDLSNDNDLNDIKKMSKDQLLGVRAELENSLKDVKESMADLDKEIDDMEWEAIYKRTTFFTHTIKKNKVKKIKKKLKAFKSKEDMDKYTYKKLEDESSYKIFGKQQLQKDTLNALWNAKYNLFAAEDDLNSQIALIDEQLKSIENN